MMFVTQRELNEYRPEQQAAASVDTTAKTKRFGNTFYKN